MTFRHHGARVLVADFDRDMITDFGYSGYSMSTTGNICGWTRALQCLGWISLKSFGGPEWPYDWTYDYTHNKKPRFKGAGYHEDMYKRFCAHAPWVHRDREGFPWFHGPKWNVDTYADFRRVRDECLNDGVSWHWFTGAWNKAGRWVKTFIDDKAKERYEARQKRKAA